MSVTRKFFYFLDQKPLSEVLVVSFTDQSKAGAIEWVRGDNGMTQHHFLKRNDSQNGSSSATPFVYVHPNTFIQSFRASSGKIGLTADGGSFSLEYDGVTSGAIAWNATGADIQALLRVAWAAKGFATCLCTGVAGGPWFLDRVTVGLALEISVDADALSPEDSDVTLYISQPGNADLPGRWEFYTSRALPVYQNTWEVSPDPEVVIAPVQAGEASQNKIDNVSWNADAYGGAVWLQVSAGPGPVVRTIGPISYNATAAEFQTLLQGHSAIGSGNVSVFQNSPGNYDVTWQGALDNTDGGTITEGNNSLQIPSFLFGRMPVSSAGTDELLQGSVSLNTFDYEAEILDLEGERSTIAQLIGGVIFSKDLMGQSPGRRVLEDRYYTVEEINALLATYPQFLSDVTEYFDVTDGLNTVITADGAMPLNKVVQFYIAGVGMQTYQLVTGNTPTDMTSFTVILPDDHDDSTNNVMWNSM